MPKKKFTFTPSHEKFCQHFAEYGSAVQAYLFAWPKNKYDSAKAHAHNMLQNVEVSSRIEQIKDEFAVQYKQTKDGTVRDLINSAEEAKKAFQFGAYAKLREMIIKMCGFYEPDKIDMTTNGESLNKITIEIINPLNDEAEGE